MFNRVKAERLTKKAKNRLYIKQLKAIQDIIKIYAKKGASKVSLKKRQIATKNIEILKKKGFKIEEIGPNIIIKW